jgi:mannose-6-phosphate isomerase-like protein (cupin superfamily)
MRYKVIENPVTGERVIPRIAPTEDNGWWAVSDHYAPPGARAVARHIHPNTTEIFTIVRGHIAVRLGERTFTTGPGIRIEVPPGTSHDWWNAGDETAWVIVEASPGQRFETLTRNLFFLAADDKTDHTGRPGLLQTALLAREFDDTMRLASPPHAVQRILFAALAPLARWRGYRGSYPDYDQRVCGTVDELEPLPLSLAALLAAHVGGLDRVPRPARYRGPHE